VHGLTHCAQPTPALGTKAPLFRTSASVCISTNQRPSSHFTTWPVCRNIDCVDWNTGCPTTVWTDSWTMQCVSRRFLTLLFCSPSKRGHLAHGDLGICKRKRAAFNPTRGGSAGIGVLLVVLAFCLLSSLIARPAGADHAHTCPIPGLMSGVPLAALPKLQVHSAEPVGWFAAKQMCPGLEQCPVKRHRIVYPIIAHRNRLEALARYVASMAVVGHGFSQSNRLMQQGPSAQAALFARASQAALWARLLEKLRPHDAVQQLVSDWAKCTCIIVSDFNTTIPIGQISGDDPGKWSLSAHGLLREVVNMHWPGHVAWVNNHEVFSSALANSRGFAAIPTTPNRSIVHVSVADLLHTSAKPFEYAVRAVQAGAVALLPLTWYTQEEKDAHAQEQACWDMDTGTGGFEPEGSGVIFTYLSDIHRAGGYSPGMLRRSEWGYEDWDLVCRLQRTGLEVTRSILGGFCHVWHERNFNREQSLNGIQ